MGSALWFYVLCRVLASQGPSEWSVRSDSVPEWPTSVWIRPLGGHGRPLTVVPHPLRASLQLLQPNPQLPLLPEQTTLQLLSTLVLLLQLLKREGREKNKWAADQTLGTTKRHDNHCWGKKAQRLRRHICRTLYSQPGLHREGALFTFMWSWARLSRLRVVFLMESDEWGTCFLSCSRQCLNWARLQNKTTELKTAYVLAIIKKNLLCCHLSTTTTTIKMFLTRQK